MPQWQSPIELALRSGSRASGAMQKELDNIASSGSVFRTIDPRTWISAAAHVFMAAFGVSTADSAANTPGAIALRAASAVAPGVSAQPGPVKSGTVPSEPPPYITTVRTAGWGRNPFHPPAPIPATLSDSSTLQQQELPGVSAADLQTVINTDALFYFYSLPEPGGSSAGIADYEKGVRNVIGFHLSETLHRFEVTVSAPTNRAPLAARFSLGESVGTCTWRWMMMPENFLITSGAEPPVTPMERDAAQRFAMLDGLFRFGDGHDGFHATGTGQTFPAVTRGRKELHITAMGVLTDGFGKFRDRQNGVFVYSGTIDASGFRGAAMLRVGDIDGTLQTSDPLPAMEAVTSPEHGVTWLTIYAEATPSTNVASLPSDTGQPGIIFQQDLRLIDMDFTTRGGTGTECATAIRQLVGSVTSRVACDVTVGDGTGANPMPFAVWHEFSFVDFLGKPVGGFIAESTDGNAVYSPIGETRGIRFASTGRVVSGTQRFGGISALLCENTFIALDPYAGSSVYTLRVDDPEGRFFAHAGVWRDIPEAEIQRKK